MRKTILLTLSLASLGMLPAMAQLGNTVWTDFQQYAQDLGSYLYLTNATTEPIPYDNFPDPFRPIESEIQYAIDNTTPFYVEGVSTVIKMLPNPIAAANYVRWSLPDKSINPSGTFENNPVVLNTIASNEINRQITYSVVEGVLGQSGQIRSKVKLENVQLTVNRIEDDVQQAEKDIDDNLPLQQSIENACQVVSSIGLLTGAQLCLESKQTNLQLQILKTQRDQAKMVGESLAYTIQGNQSLQYSNLNLANISQQIEEANRARRVDASAEATRLLRVTSQADLIVNQDSGVTTQE